MTRPFDFSGQHVFVSGGTSGINLGIAHSFAEAGAKLTVMSRSQGKVDAAIADLQRHAGEVTGFAADVRQPAAVDDALKRACERFGTIDVLISGAAGNFPAAAADISPNGFKAVVEIDLLGSFHTIRAALPLLKQPGGCIINISAPQSYNPMELQMHVCAAKAGVDMLTRVGALEWGPLGIRINSISPGPIADTEGMRRLAPTPEAEAVVARSVPLQRFGTTREIGNCALWLASPMAAYVTGAVIPVDGGWGLGGTATAFSGLREPLAGK